MRDKITEGGREAKKHKKAQRSCRRDVGNGGDADPDNLENGKEVGREEQGTQDLSKNCTKSESVPPLSRLIIGFVIDVVDPLLAGSMQVA